MGRSASAWDVLQETNLVLWKEQADFQPGTRFEARAYTVARFQVLAYLDKWKGMPEANGTRLFR